MAPTPDQLIASLRDHQPVPNSVVRRNVLIRWVATITAGILAPVGLALGLMNNHELLLSGSALTLVGIGALMVLASGWKARRSHGLNGQWGFAPLGKEEIRELSAIANADPELGEIVDLWAARCVESGSNLRGRDLMVLRKKARLYLKAKDDTMPSISPRVR